MRLYSREICKLTANAFIGVRKIGEFCEQYVAFTVYPSDLKVIDASGVGGEEWVSTRDIPDELARRRQKKMEIWDL